MSLQTLVQTPPEQWGHVVPSLSLVTERHRAALSELKRAYYDNRALTVLTGQGKFESNHVISGFLTSLDEDVSVVRLTKPYDDALSGMREINRALGFEPKDLSLSDLDNILKMFLSFQRKHRRRTVLCIEQAHKQGRWLLDHIRRLVELEVAGEFGLMTILSGRPSLNELLSQSPLEVIQAQAGKPITLAPFSLKETTEFVRQRVEAAGNADISQLFDFDAIRCLHEASEGVPDNVGLLCFKCLELANQQKSDTVTVELVSAAERLLRPEDADENETKIISISPHSMARINGEERPAEVERRPAEVAEPQAGRVNKLVVIQDNEIIHQFMLPQGRFMVGRAKTSDIRLPSSAVSRRHALVINTSEGVKVLDLGSTNGTYVNCQRVYEDQSLEIGDVIMIGDCRLEYVTQ